MKKPAAEKAQKGRPATKEELQGLIKTKDEWVVGALIRLYSLQDADEQASHSTRKENYVGFNALDARGMTSIAKFYLDRHYLTEGQIKYVRKVMIKYCGQLVGVGGVEPLPIKKAPKAEKIKETKWAGLTGGGKDILIKFSFPKNREGRDKFQEALAIVKTLSGRRWNPDDKAWTTPLTIGSYESLVEWGFEVAPKLRKWHKDFTAPLKYKEFDIPGFETEYGKGSEGLLPFQRKGVAFAESRNGRALIADDMGLGKTAQALAWLQLNKAKALPALAIVPANVKLHWKRCCQNWTEIKTVVLYGRNANGTTHIDAQAGGEDTLTIINYDILEAWVPTLENSQFKTIIGDEIHFIKNSKANRTRAFKKLARKVKYFLPLSGTPIESRPLEFFNCLNLLHKELFTWPEFTQQYCNPTYNVFATRAMQAKEDRKAKAEERAPEKVKPVYDYKGASNTERLHRILTSTVMIRRKKKEVMPELPDKIRSIIPVELQNREEYEKAEDEFMQDEGKLKRNEAEALMRIAKLRQLTAKGKMGHLQSWIGDYLESTDVKLVVFAWHQKVIDQLMSHFKKEKVGVVKIDGRDSEKKRQQSEDAFNDDPKTRLFIGNIQAAGVGISLRGASDTCFVETYFNPGPHDQAEDRVIGINRGIKDIETSTAYYLLAEDTVDEDLAAIADDKRKVVGAILDGEKVEEKELLSELFKRMKDRRKSK